MGKFDLLRRKRQSGQSLVEAALVMTIFLVVFIGIIDVGQVLFVHQTLVERTRAALRYGTVHPFDATAMQNVVLYGSPAPETPDGGDGVNPTPGIFNLTPEMVQVSREAATFNEDRLVIQITNYPFRFYTPFIAGLRVGKPIRATIPYEGI